MGEKSHLQTACLPMSVLDFYRTGHALNSLNRQIRFSRFFRWSCSITVQIDCLDKVSLPLLPQWTHRPISCWSLEAMWVHSTMNGQSVYRLSFFQACLSFQQRKFRRSSPKARVVPHPHSTSSLEALSQRLQNYPRLSEKLSPCRKTCRYCLVGFSTSNSKRLATLGCVHHTCGHPQTAVYPFTTPIFG